MALPTGSPGDRILNWKRTHWPPKNMRKCGELPIYIGSHEAVTDFYLALGQVVASVSDHIFDECRGKTPRWMAVPKVIFGVERINLAKAPAKASRRFSDTAELVKRCGMFEPVDVRKLDMWLQANPSGELVAHKPFVDMRAYVFARGESPKRVRFYESGLVVAAPEGLEIVMQDHRTTIRSKRSDAFSEPIARNLRGWEVFPAPDAKN